MNVVERSEWPDVRALLSATRLSRAEVDALADHVDDGIEVARLERTTVALMVRRLIATIRYGYRPENPLR